jgi:acyl-CoA synthetase (AMP-forming)/AMP-acid ligase II
MLGLMQHWPLTIDKILAHAARCHGSQEVVSGGVQDPIRRSYETIYDRARRASSALITLGVGPGDRVGTLAWNSVDHLEAWYAIMGMGAICHTLNPRMGIDQLAWIASHAGNRILLVDNQLRDIARDIQARCPAIKHLVTLDGARGDPIGWDSLVGAHAPASWGGFDEQTACGLCYTSGTTGDPKGVLYSHRSNFLHTLTVLQRDVFGLGARDVVLPIVPMFHANAWGLVFAAPAAGARLVLPGQHLDGPSLHRLIEQEQVSFAAAVPTVWQDLLDHLERTGESLGSLTHAVAGGATCPAWIVKALEDRHGVAVSHAWGMTELSPMGTIWAPTAATAVLPPIEQGAIRLKQGRPPLGVELRIGGADDAKTGHLEVSGFAVARAYYGHHESILNKDGFLDTGDIGSIDKYGFLSITDRDKDVIKSGGEWISSIAIENIIASHPAIEQAAVVGAQHPRWGERPLLLVVIREGETVSREELIACLEDKVPRWWTPDEVIVIDAMPQGPTGKIDKRSLRTRFHTHLLEADAKEKESK